MSFILLQPNTSYTLENNNDIKFLGENGDVASIIVRNRNFRIKNEDGFLVWDYNNIDETIFLDDNEYMDLDFGGFWTRITYTGIDDGYLTLNIEVSIFDCNTNNTLSTEQTESLTQCLRTENTNPSGSYHDFQNWQRNWESLVLFKQLGIICDEDVPNEPKIKDYL